MTTPPISAPIAVSQLSGSTRWMTRPRDIGRPALSHAAAPPMRSETSVNPVARSTLAPIAER
jgi:hypothetical protein